MTVGREEIRGLIKDIQTTDPGKISVDLSGPGPQFHCTSCDFEVYWSHERFICPHCEFEFSVMNAIDLLQIQIDLRQADIDKMITVQVGLLTLLPEDLKEQVSHVTAAPQRRGFWGRFFKGNRSRRAEAAASE